MPWGALTGIRPTKLAYTELEKGLDFRPLFEKMCVSEQNIQLVTRILKTQEGIFMKVVLMKSPKILSGILRMIFKIKKQ